MGSAEMQMLISTISSTNLPDKDLIGGPAEPATFAAQTHTPGQRPSRARLVSLLRTSLKASGPLKKVKSRLAPSKNGLPATPHGDPINCRCIHASSLFTLPDFPRQQERQSTFAVGRSWLDHPFVSPCPTSFACAANTFLR